MSQAVFFSRDNFFKNMSIIENSMTKLRNEMSMSLDKKYSRYVKISQKKSDECIPIEIQEMFSVKEHQDSRNF